MSEEAKTGSAKITVLMTVYNHEHFLKQAIESVLNQTYNDFHLLIIDDCSPDSSFEIAQRYQRLDSRITAIRSPKNLKRARLFNKYIKQCQSTYVAVMDSDDYWLPTKLQQQIAIFETSEDIVVVHTEGIIVDSRPEIARHYGNSTWPPDVNGKLFSTLHYSPIQKSGDVLKSLLHGSFIFFSSALIKTSCLQQVKMCEDLQRSEDWMFFIDLSLLGNFVYIEEPLTVYRIHGYNEQDRLGNKLEQEIINSRLFLLKNYDKYISSASKSHHYKRIGNAYRRSSNFKAAWQYLGYSLLHRPQDIKTWIYLFLTILRTIRRSIKSKAPI